MRSIIHLFLLVLLNNLTNAQITASKAGTYPFLEQPVSQFRDSLICGDAGHTGKTFTEKSDCFSYRYTDTLALYQYGPVVFAGSFVFPDLKSGIIETLMHFKASLRGDDRTNVKKDFRSLASYFDSTMGKRTVPNRPLVDDEKLLIWISATHKISLQLSTFEKKKGRKVTGILSLSIERLK